MKTLRTTGVLASLMLLAACVTINIYFPAAEAEQAAERIVDDILGKQKPDAKSGPADDKGAALDLPLYQQIAGRVLNLLVPPAHAAKPDFTVNTPKIRKLQAGMKQRHKSLAKYYSSGGIGFTKDALVATHNAKAIPLKERGKVKKLVAAENRDRNALYKAIANANGHPEWEGDVRSTFARTWAQKANKGWWYQTSSGNWKQK